MIRHAAALAFILVSASAAGAAEDSFRARGNEPFWSLEKSAGSIVFRPMEGEPVTVSPVPVPRREGDADVFEATVDGEAFVVTVADDGKVCVDTMSGMPFPHAVTVSLGADSFAGCGGEPASLLVGDWTIREIGGKPVVAGSEPSISFEAGGAVNGGASCNRFFGSFALTGEGLAIGELGSSMMICEDPVMEQEHAVLEILKGVTGFGIGEGGSLTLTAGDGRTIVAEPVP